MAIEHPHVSLIGPVIERDPATLDPIVELKKDVGPNYSDHSPELSDADINTLRGDIEKFNKHLPPDQLAVKLAAFDKEAANAGVAIKPIDHHLVETLRTAGLSAEPSPTDYHPDLSKLTDLAPDNLAAVASVTMKFVAELGLSPSIGNSVIERIVEVGAFMKTASADEQQQWKDRQEGLGLKVTGSKADLVALREKALSVLNRASANEFTRDLKNSLVVNDIQILSLLATHADTLAEVERVRKQK